MIQIIPAILANSKEQYQDDIAKLSTCDDFKNGWVHIDFADNMFVPNKTIEPDIVAKYPLNLKKEAHLMVVHPKEWVDALVESGFGRIIFHIESKDNIDDVIDYIKNRGLEVGIAINMDTLLESIEPFIPRIDVVLVMSIVPGFQGQEFMSESLERMRLLKSKKWFVKIGVDGAVRYENAKQIMQTGIDFMVVGSYFLKGDTDKNYQRLVEVLNG